MSLKTPEQIKKEDVSKGVFIVGFVVGWIFGIAVAVGIMI